MPPAPGAFALLHPKVQRWIYDQGWEALREIQERSIPVLLDGSRDAIVAAATASGKTEAAFLPIVSRLASLAEEGGEAGFGALYVSPLKALINDQFRRVESLCEELDLPVFKWHGDVAASAKARARRVRRGIVLITPESLEALLVRRGDGEARALLRGLPYVVVDELHAFLDEPRGKQLQSLLRRLERAAGRRVARVGLSATLADLGAAAAFLRPEEPSAVEILEARSAPLDLRLQLRGYVDPATTAHAEATASGEEAPGPAEAAMVRHLYGALRGRKGLLFAGSRNRVELFSAALACLCEADGVPGEFFPHHGSLSREWREDAEARMRDPSRPSTVVCTTTLELGIDVGSIEGVAQVGPGQTVAGMRQRLGRSGRRPGQPAVMRVYVAEQALHARSHPLDTLRTTTVRAMAMTELLLERWMEPPRPGALHLSTLLHQILALICQHGGTTASRAYRELVASGVFGAVPAEVFGALLRRMGHPEVRLLEQAPDGTLLPGPEAERLAAGHDFFAVFETPEEYRIVHAGRPLGTVPVEFAPAPDQLVIFAGRGWRVEAVEPARREIAVQPARGGAPPRFGGADAAPHDGVVRRMRELYGGAGTPRYLDPGAARLLEEARGSFARLGLAERPILERGAGELLLFPWVGGRRQAALALALLREGLKASPLGVAVLVEDASPAETRDALARIEGRPAHDPVELAALVGDRRLDKYDRYLDDDLLRANYASRMIDTTGLGPLAGDLLGRRA